MSNKIKIKCRDRRGFITVEEIFGRNLNIGDYILFSVNFMYNTEYKAPVCVITEEGLCWYNSALASYTIINELFNDENYLYVYKLNPEKNELGLINNSSNIVIPSLINNVTDIWQRKLNAGDLLLYYLDEYIKNAVYLVCIAEEEAFNGYYKINLFENYYIIDNPTSEELDIKRKLYINYNRFMQQKIEILALGKRRGDYFIHSDFRNNTCFYLGKSDVFVDKDMYLCFDNNFTCFDTSIFDILEKYGLDYDNFLNYLKEEEAYYNISIELYDSNTTEIIKEKDFIGHVDIKLTNDEIFDTAIEIYNENVKSINLIMQAEYSNLEMLNKAQLKLSTAISNKYKREILKLTKRFNGSYEDYRKYISSINKRKGKELFYYSKCLRTKEVKLR